MNYPTIILLLFIPIYFTVYHFRSVFDIDDDIYSQSERSLVVGMVSSIIAVAWPISILFGILYYIFKLLAKVYHRWIESPINKK